MNWIDRYQMMIDISTGMEFLHSKSFPNGGAKQDVFHQDLKSGNIQLYSKNKSLRAKISDFGLSILRDYSFVSENLLRSHYSHENLSVVNLNGWTEEYKAPELQSDTAQFTKLCDVYSFGIILLELITLNQSNSKLVKTLKSSLHLLKFGKLEICNSLGYILEKSLNLNYKLRLPFKNLRILILSEKIEIIKYFSTNDGIFKCKIEYEDVL
ncbi:hypothetical protein HK099_001517 [Clydaea vesicula]|uniref:Protein kinase domain-containing protein n=1 Tax=Clydaea vesicula TaxID=447962 RepID=A0AAD5XX66_9FUNG|nr:hypothetical protein HK099_001517 [Clydaea vesicula]